MQVKKQQLEPEWINKLVPYWERSTSRLYIVTLLIQLMCRVHHAKCPLDESQAGVKIARRNINNLRYVDDVTIMAESEEELRFLIRVKKKKKNEKADLKLNI